MSGRPLLAAHSSSFGDPTSSSSVSPNQGNTSAATATPNSSRNNKHNNNTTTKPKRTLIESACGACRRRKSRCDGVRPACARCVALKTECIYQTEDGESRWSALKRKNSELASRSTELEAERDELRDLVSQLQSRPEPESLEILQRIRRCSQYYEVFDIVRDLRAGPLTVHVPSTGFNVTGIPMGNQGGLSPISQQSPGLVQPHPPSQPPSMLQNDNRLPPLRVVLGEDQLNGRVDSRGLRSSSLGPTPPRDPRSQTPGQLRSERTI